MLFRWTYACKLFWDGLGRVDRPRASRVYISLYLFKGFFTLVNACKHWVFESANMAHARQNMVHARHSMVHARQRPMGTALGGVKN